MIRLAKGKLCFFDLRIGCFVIASFSLVFYIALAAWVVYNTVTVTSQISLKDPEAMVKLTKVLLIGQLLFPVATTLMKYKIILLIGLRMKSRILIKIYLAFAKYAFIFYVAVCVGFQFFNPLDPYVNGASISIPIHASFIYTIWSYWKRLEPKNTKMQQHIV